MEQREKQKIGRGAILLVGKIITRVNISLPCYPSGPNLHSAPQVGPGLARAVTLVKLDLGGDYLVAVLRTEGLHYVRLRSANC